MRSVDHTAAVDGRSPALPRGLQVSARECEHFRVMRVRSNESGVGMLPELPRDDSHIVAIKLQPLAQYDLFLHNRHASRKPIPTGGLCLIHPDSDPRLDLQSPFDIVQFHFPIRRLAASLAGDAEHRTYALRAPPVGTPDLIADQLARVFLPVLEHPKLASPLFLSHIAMALSAHLLHTYGSVEPDQRRRGGLARWQEQRTKELLAANLDGALSMAELAGICGMTPSHFATAFRHTTGMSPTTWLAKLRIAKACELLQHTQLPLADIAIASGFGDQAHFTRCFSRRIGLSPGNWRRQT